MIVDTSAVVAIFQREPGYERLLEALASVDVAGIGAPTLVEAGIVLAARLRTDVRSLLGRFLAESGIVEIPFGDAHWSVAIDAYARYGKGKHRAGLNFGDCLTYATAKVARLPLLYVGEDFSKTDLESAL
jgi:ribonuclease VapC